MTSTQWLDLVFDQHNYETAAVQAIKPVLEVLDHVMDDQVRRRMIAGDALIAVFAAGAQFAVAEQLAQIHEHGIPVRMGRFEIEGDVAGFLAKYAGPRPGA